MLQVYLSTQQKGKTSYRKSLNSKKACYFINTKKRILSCKSQSVHVSMQTITMMTKYENEAYFKCFLKACDQFSVTACLPMKAAYPGMSEVEHLQNIHVSITGRVA